jgi:hypothetical protein
MIGLIFEIEYLILKYNIMRKLVLLFTFSLIFFSCEKDYLIPEDEIPEWLKTKIKQEEQIIKESPHLMNAYGAWLRYKWQNEYYFEYHNFLSSSSPVPIKVNGERLYIIANDINTDYCKEKCCKQFVWKAPKYKDYYEDYYEK